MTEEGRFLRVDYDDFILMNIYFPNGKPLRSAWTTRWPFTMPFLNMQTPSNAERKKLVICGDVNTAHKEIDRSHPRENKTISGFLPEERAWIDKFLAAGYIDTFRMFNTNGGNYSWWSIRTRARERNIGWRLDYFFVSENLLENIKSAPIYSEIAGSDHCSIVLELKFTV